MSGQVAKSSSVTVH